MTTFEVVPARPWHAGQMVRLLRRDHAQALLGATVNVHRQLHTIAAGSPFCRAWLIDGRLAALGGVHGTLSSAVGHIWLALSDEAARHPVAVFREARRQIDEMMETRRELVTTVLANDRAARRFALALGFHVGHEETVYTGDTRHALDARLDVDKSMRLEIYGVTAIPMGYHH